MQRMLILWNHSSIFRSWPAFASAAVYRSLFVIGATALYGQEHWLPPVWAYSWPFTPQQVFTLKKKEKKKVSLINCKVQRSGLLVSVRDGRWVGYWCLHHTFYFWSVRTAILWLHLIKPQQPSNSLPFLNHKIYCSIKSLYYEGFSRKWYQVSCYISYYRFTQGWWSSDFSSSSSLCVQFWTCCIAGWWQYLITRIRQCQWSL